MARLIGTQRGLLNIVLTRFMSKHLRSINGLVPTGTHDVSGQATNSRFTPGRTSERTQLFDLSFVKDTWFVVLKGNQQDNRIFVAAPPPKKHYRLGKHTPVPAGVPHLFLPIALTTRGTRELRLSHVIKWVPRICFTRQRLYHQTPGTCPLRIRQKSE